MRKFDTKVQDLTYRVLREVARLYWNGELNEHILDIPYTIVPGTKPTMRCCVYKERAIVAERVRMAQGGHASNPNIIEVIEIACDECPSAGYSVSDSCRGCLAHRCADACRKDAIWFDDNYVAHIDKSKCVNCGACAKVCPYSAILDHKRPCQKACKAHAISINEENNAAHINNDKCTNCGACVYMCPWGAIIDKSFLLDVIDILKHTHGSQNSKVYAVVAPSISSQFTYATTGQVITGLHRLGFDVVMEAALGADMVAQAESKELAEEGFLTSSCCPAFVQLIKNNFPDLVPHISRNLSPMATIARYIKQNMDPDAKIVFIGPCTAKKKEIQQDEVKPYVDSAMTFEELQALFDARDIDITTLEETPLDNASYFGRIFAKCGGLADAVREGLKEQGLTDFELKPYSCDGMEDCYLALLKKSKGVLDANFIEGMACVGGCIGGPGCLTHDPRSKLNVEKYGREANSQTITDALDGLQD